MPALTPLQRARSLGRETNALVRAIEALETIQATIAGNRGAAPSWLAEEILGAGQEIDDHRAAVWLSEN